MSGSLAVSRPAAMANNFLNKEPQTIKHYENDPLSLISLFAKKHAAPPPPAQDSSSFGATGEQLVPER